jgi:DNA end-binding protein Ku
MAVAWEPEKYRDEYRSAVLELIEQKAQNREIADKPATPTRTTNVVDLVKVLQESLNRNQAAKPKRNGTSNGASSSSRPTKRSTSTLVKQRRRVAA